MENFEMTQLNELSKIASKIEHIQQDHDRLLTMEQCLKNTSDSIDKLMQAITENNKSHKEMLEIINRNHLAQKEEINKMILNFDEKVSKRPTWGIIIPGTLAITAAIGNLYMIYSSLSSAISNLTARTDMMQTLLNSLHLIK